MAKITKSTPLTTREVREFFAAHPNLIPEGSEACVRVGNKGRVSPAAVKVAEKATGRKFAEGSSVKALREVTYTVQNARGAKIKKSALLPLAEIQRLAGVPQGTKGRPTKDMFTKAGEALAKA